MEKTANEVCVKGDLTVRKFVLDHLESGEHMDAIRSSIYTLAIGSGITPEDLDEAMDKAAEEYRANGGTVPSWKSEGFLFGAG